MTSARIALLLLAAVPAGMGVAVAAESYFYRAKPMLITAPGQDSPDPVQASVSLAAPMPFALTAGTAIDRRKR